MAAVQRTPTPVDLSSRRAFIESMEEELKRVQEHLDRRQWKQRSNGSSGQQWYNSLNRSNPNKRRLWDQRDKDHDDEDSDEVFCRVSSAQDPVRRSSVSSCSSRSPTSSPETIRVKSPRRLPSTHYANIPSFSSPVRGLTSPTGNFSSPTRNVMSPLSALSPRDYPLSVKEPPLSPTYKSSFTDPPLMDTTPLMVKEMAYAFQESLYHNSDSMGYDAEEDEVDEDGKERVTKEVMPSALDDLYTGGDHSESSTTHNITTGNGTPSHNNHHKMKDHHLIDKRNTEGVEVKTTNFLKKDHFDKSRLEQLKRMKELREEKAQSDRQLSSVIDQLQMQLREKEKDFEALQAQHLAELNVREDRIKKLSRQNARLEREKWDLLKRAREAAERSVNLRTKLDMHEASLRSLQVELDRSNDELSAVKSANSSLRGLVRELKTRKPVSEASVQVDTISTLISIGNTPPDILHREYNEESDSGHASGGGGHVSSEDWGERISITSSQCDTRETTPTNSFHERQGRERRSMRNLLKFKFRRSASAGKRHSTSSLSQANTSSLDNLQLSQSSLTVPSTTSSRSHSPNPHRRSAVSLHEVAVDPHTILQEFQSVPFPQWNTKAIVAWMEVVVGMPQYISTVRQYVTSGHAMLALTNTDIEKRLMITHPFHRRRLRLAIEDLRNPSTSERYHSAGTIDHNWVSYTWAVGCGLPHLSSTLYNGMVNGHILNSITRDDLKKYLKVTKKVEQLSFLSGVELLRMHEFNIESIKTHHDTTSNPLYWTNKDICEWLKKINLEEYADNVIGCGVHGALLFLERTNFNSEHLANIIRLPAKSIQRKHLAAQLAKLFSTEEIGSFDEEQMKEDELTPDQYPLTNSTGIDHSPHPSRRMLTQTSSIPNLVDEAQNEDSVNFDRSHIGRRSLRESMLRSVVHDTPVTRNRPVSQLVSTTTV